MAIRKALQRWKGPATDLQSIAEDKNHPENENAISLTKQSLKDETLISTIIRRSRAGVVEHVNRYEGRYGDATAMDLQKSLELVRETEKWFEKLPLEAKKEFKQDPVKAVEFLDKVEAGDPDAIKLGRMLGMVEPERPQAAPAPAPEPIPEPVPEPVV